MLHGLSVRVWYVTASVLYVYVYVVRYANGNTAYRLQYPYRGCRGLHCIEAEERVISDMME